MAFRPRKEATDVRFIVEASFRKIVSVVSKMEHRAFLWLAWDIGENAGSILQIRVSDVTRQVNEQTGEPEYAIALRRDVLKRGRTPRVVVTNYRDTVEALDLILVKSSDNEMIFCFGWRMALKILERAGGITNITCTPGGQKVTLKDLRSSMACDLLSKHWTTDEVNQRLGHKPSSREIDKYVNWLALDRHRPKRRFHENQVRDLERQVVDLQDSEKLAQKRQHSLREQLEELQKQMERNNRLLHLQLSQLAHHLKGGIA